MIGQVLQGTYRIERLIGKGGMGAVFEATHLRVSRRFAVKVLAAHLAEHPEAVARFRQEAEVASSIGHPHILAVLDFNHLPDGRPYLVTELLEGENLNHRLERCGRRPLDEAASIFEQAASALQAVHAHGIVHRDLKPANLFLCRDGRRDIFVRVLDFGISKVLDSESLITKANVVLGSPHYMSPEQALGQSAMVDQRCDVYSMGVMVFHMLAGRPPFDAPQISDLLRQIISADPPPMRSFGAPVSRELDEVVARALGKLPHSRFESMEEFWAAFSTWLPQQGERSFISTGPGLHAEKTLIVPEGEGGTATLEEAGTSSTTLPPAGRTVMAPETQSSELALPDRETQILHQQVIDDTTDRAGFEAVTRRRRGLLLAAAGLFVLLGAAGVSLWVGPGERKPPGSEARAPDLRVAPATATVDARPALRPDLRSPAADRRAATRDLRPEPAKVAPRPAARVKAPSVTRPRPPKKGAAEPRKDWIIEPDLD